eukprot:1230038-Pleurochrysis_carterae.AAC.1
MAAEIGLFTAVCIALAIVLARSRGFCTAGAVFVSLLLMRLAITIMWTVHANADFATCPLGGAPLPVWSRGLAYCADVGPPTWKAGKCERGVGALASWGRIEHDSVVYVPTCNLHEFVEEVFPSIARNASIVLLTGGEDAGVPREIWNGGARIIGHARRIRTPLRAFLRDSRLRAWFVQNLDIVQQLDMPGCGREGGCAERIDEDAASKVRTVWRNK